MAEESDLERSFPATPRRIEQARSHGQVARSRELTTAAVALAAALCLAGLGPHFMAQCLDLVRDALRFDRAAVFGTGVMGESLAGASLSMLLAVAPLLLVLLAASIAGAMLLSGWNFSGKALMPDFGRLNPVKGFGNIVSGRAAAELGKTLLKSALIAIAGAVALVQLWGAMQGLASVDVALGIVTLGSDVMHAVFILVAGLVLIAGLDVPYQLWRYYHGLRMTREELRQEMREQEGDPQLKARIRSVQRDAARKRMMAAVPKASVIVTNPTHYAVALSYQEGMRAPRVVAKGTELVAQKIRELGTSHGVPIVEAPPLARALHRHTEIDQEIPQRLYNVVAQVLAYVYQVQRWKSFGGAMPSIPTDLDVPADMDPNTARRDGDAGAGAHA